MELTPRPRSASLSDSRTTDIACHAEYTASYSTLVLHEILTDRPVPRGFECSSERPCGASSGTRARMHGLPRRAVCSLFTQYSALSRELYVDNLTVF